MHIKQQLRVERGKVEDVEEERRQDPHPHVDHGEEDQHLHGPPHRLQQLEPTQQRATCKSAQALP